MNFSSSRRKGSFPSSSSFANNHSQYSTIIQHINYAGKTIETTVTYDAATITQWITDVSSIHTTSARAIVGLDVEWKPNRTKYMNNKAATLQLCIGTKCLVIQLIYLVSVPKSLRDFLSFSSNNTFVGVEVASDVAKLNREYGFACRNTEDLREVAIRNGYVYHGPKPGLKGLARDLVGLTMAKPKYVTLSNWEVRDLSAEQIEYACIDAYASYRIGSKLLVHG